MKDFIDYWRSLSPKEKCHLASAAGKKTNYISRVINGHRGLSLKLVEALVNADQFLHPSMFIKNSSHFEQQAREQVNDIRVIHATEPMGVQSPPPPLSLPAEK